MRIHLIGIGGAAMHNLAIALKLAGHHVTGSDTLIFDPALSRLRQYELYPSSLERSADAITSDIDIIILGMAIFPDNAEWMKAQELGLQIMSYPEFIYAMSKDKCRVVIGGSHGKTTTTGMIMHCMQYAQMDFDYLVGSSIQGFDVMVRLSDAPIIVIEGDEYPDSKINLTPKFHVYKHHIGVLNGIDRDHVNIYDTWDKYTATFTQFAEQTPPDGVLFYNQTEQHVLETIHSTDLYKQHSEQCVGYDIHPYEIQNTIMFALRNDQRIPLQVLGEHNMINLNAAKHICIQLGMSEELFYQAIQSFQPALNRLNKLLDRDDVVVFKDFAHSPSKLQATCRAIKQSYATRKVIGVFGLHTFSSLNREFFVQYAHHFDDVDQAIVFYNPAIIERKRLASFTDQDIKDGFMNDHLIILHEPTQLQQYIKTHKKDGDVYLLMSSGSFDGLDIVGCFE